ncbi:MAG: TIGR02710 family CRISPR-associated protein [Smithella sp.]|nr:TIGR02710 family CRISPR-associated protein [Smithella sp.]MDM7986610.1 TIGR02710 family CRISPR-associated CARF protein [Smithella sp.]HOU51741.1 TIGR02710 family CRISPR-associated CARF protein [Smithella sp.]HQG66321.1 TIGR02710 family CRISPR-associated CARF protein [Smithella sp.]HQI24209.1 TIGR02710 family CRISPR-associated CARF protein [Smithella sp.]
MKKVMIMSLGGSPEPLRKSLAEHQPHILIFFASHDSVIKSGEVLQGLATKPKTETEITENPNSLYECYKAAKRCIDRAARREIPEQDIIVDYTGGTKVMSAALLLATAGHAFGFNYVGGDERSKDGLGVVQNGHEQMYEDMNPWAAFAEEERRQIVTLFNARRYTAVIQILDLCKRQLPAQIGAFFQFVRPLANGFLFWEQFRHKEALDCLKKGATLADDYLKHYADEHYTRLREELQNHINYLADLLTKTNGMQISNMILIKELINNARRRMDDKRFDDAAARIYRALELYGQICFEKTVGCANDRVKPAKIPEELREEFIRKYRDPQTDMMKLPLQATFTVLRAAGHDAGQRFFECEKKIKDIQSARNKSILAHGIQPVSERAAQSILETVTDFVQMKEYFDFPALRE